MSLSDFSGLYVLFISGSGTSFFEHACVSLFSEFSYQRHAFSDLVF
jgi:hypothetical protein